MTTTAAVALAIVSAAAYAVAAVAQARAAAPTRRTRLLRTPALWLSVALNGAGAATHVAALRYGPLTVVQALGALTLVLALPVEAVASGRRVTRRQWHAAAAVVAGLGGLLAVLAGAAPAALDDRQIALVLAGTALTVAALTRRTRRSRRSRGLRLAAASGATFAVGSVLTQTIVLRLDAGARPGATLAAATVAAVALSIGGLLLSQAAYRSGLGGPLAVLTVANPLVSAVIGMTLLEHAAALSATDAGVAVAATALATAGAVSLATTRGGGSTGPPAGRGQDGTGIPPGRPAVTGAATVAVPVPAVRRRLRTSMDGQAA